MIIQNVKDLLTQQINTASFSLQAIQALENAVEEQNKKIQELLKQIEELKGSN